jgi:fructuronate reductase
MTGRLGLASLGSIPHAVRRPRYDVGALGVGIVHLGLGAFHRAHQAVFTEDAIEHSGGDWGIAGVSLHHSAISDVMTQQDCLYTVETLDNAPSYHVVGAIRRATGSRDEILALLSAPTTRAVTLTITEKGYCLGADGQLDFAHDDIVHDLVSPQTPRSAIGWLALGLRVRAQTGAGPLTVLSCDNLPANGVKLGNAVRAYADRAFERTHGIDAGFPQTMVDCIVPATDDASRGRVREVLGLEDMASVEREPFAQWVIENRFAGPLPDWAGVGAEIVDDVAAYERLKLHVLNASHSALAYLGLARGLRFTREAIADPELSRFVDEMVMTEIAPALAPLPVAEYWRSVRKRLANPMIEHRLAQIAEDGSVKLNARVVPILVANVRANRPFAKLATVVRAWMDFVRAPGIKDPQAARFAAWVAAGASPGALLDDPAVFPDAFRTDTVLRNALIGDGV